MILQETPTRTHGAPATTDDSGQRCVQATMYHVRPCPNDSGEWK